MSQQFNKQIQDLARQLAEPLSPWLAPLLVPKARARIAPSAGQNVITGTPTVITFGTVEFDHGGWFNAGSPTRLTAPAACTVLVAGQANFGANATGYRQVVLRVNGSTFVAFQRVPAVTDAGANTAIGTAPAIIQLAAGDYLELVVTHTAGVTLTMASSNCFLELMRVP